MKSPSRIFSHMIISGFLLTISGCATRSDAIWIGVPRVTELHRDSVIQRVSGEAEPRFRTDETDAYPLPE